MSTEPMSEDERTIYAALAKAKQKMTWGEWLRWKLAGEYPPDQLLCRLSHVDVYLSYKP